jgi:hypothetical protein
VGREVVVIGLLDEWEEEAEEGAGPVLCHLK